MLIASKSRSTIDKLKNQLFADFEMKYLGETKKILSMKIVKDREDIVGLTQKQYL